MSGYRDSREKIISTLLGRPNGEQITPEKHQDFALSLLEYIRSIELSSMTGGMAGIADENTIPIQPNDSFVTYIAAVPTNTTATFSGFIDQGGRPITVSGGEDNATLVILHWDRSSWSFITMPISVIAKSENATFNYQFSVRKTYATKQDMLDDSASPTDASGVKVRVGELVSVVNNDDPTDNGLYSYNGNGWSFQGNMNIDIVHELGNNTNKVLSQKAVTEEIANAKDWALTQIESAVGDASNGLGQSISSVESKADSAGDKAQSAHDKAVEVEERANSISVELDKTSVARFDQIVDGVSDVKVDKINEPHGIHYSTASRSFYAFYDNEYYANWDGRDKYNEEVSGGSYEARRDKLFILDKRIFVWSTSDNSLVEAGRNIEAVLNQLKSKSSNVVEVLRVLEPGERASVDGSYLVKETSGKILTIVSVTQGAVRSEIADLGKIYNVGGKTYLWNGKEFSQIGVSSGSKSGAGSGAGFLNVTALVPISPSFYDKAAAIEALKRIEMEDRDKIGAIITFETSAGEWSDYRFVGSTAGDFYDITKWVEFGLKGNFVKGINFNNETKTPNSRGLVDINIEVPSVENSLSEGSSNAVSSGAVFAEIERIKRSIPSRIVLNEIGDGDDKRYSISLMSDLSDDPIDTTAQFAAGGGGNGSVATTKIELTRLTPNKTIKNGDEISLSYRFRHIDTATGDSTGNSAKVSITITRGASSTTIEDVISSGETKDIDVTKHMITGTNNVRVRVEVGEGAERQVSSISWTISVVQLTLNSSFDISTLSYVGDVVSIPYSLRGNGNKTLKLYVDGKHVDERAISTSTSNGSFSLNTARMSHGTIPVHMVAELELSDGTIIKSNSIFLGIIVAQRNIHAPIIGIRMEHQDGRIFGNGERPTIAAKQFDSHNIVYSVFDPNEVPTLVSVVEDGGTISNTRIPLTQQSVSVRSTKYGSVVGEINCKTTKYLFNVDIERTDLNIQEPTDGLRLLLTAQGKSNNDIDRASWKYGDVTSTLEGFNFGGDGWVGGALRHIGEARTTINFMPFRQVIPSTNAFSIVMKFSCSNVTDDDAIVARCVDDNGTGFEITPTEARFKTSGNSELSMKMASGTEYEIAFVSFPRAEESSSAYEKENSEMVYLYINGIMCGALQRSSSDSIYQATAMPIVFGSYRATIDVKSVRCYNSYLSDSQILSLYIIGQDNVETLMRMFNENDLTDDNGDISVERIPEGTRVVIVTGKQVTGVPTVLHAAVTNNKKTKFDVDEILSFVRGGDPRQNFKILGGCISLQGTSSLAYPTKNYRFYSKNAKKAPGQVYVGVNDKGEGGELQETHKYSFRIAGKSGNEYNAAPVDCWCAKADYAESSSSHNTGMARLANNILVSVGDLTPPQKHADRSQYKYDVRTTVDGEPCLMFYRANPTDKPIFLGKFNLNNDKSTEDVFGFLKIKGYHDASWVAEKFSGQNPTECWEFLNNDYPMGSFKDADFDAVDRDGKPNWLKVFEARFPDNDAINAEYEAGTKKPTHLEALVKWVNSTDTEVAGLSEEQKRQRRAKFKSELSQYFDVKYLCDYYILTDVFACVDQRVKNMMMAFFYTPEVGRVLAYMIFYDNDTILGVRNDGRLKYSWDVTEETTDPELTTPQKKVYAFAGHDSVLWKNLRTEFQTELKAAYVRLRSKMTNDVIFNMFDDEQSGRFAARVFNVDAIKKYVHPKTFGVSVNRDGQVITQKYSHLESMHGDRKTHRHWFLTNRLGLFDAWCSTGLYTATDITWKGNSAAGATVRAVASREFYFEFKREGTSMVHKRVSDGEEFSYRYDQVANIGTIFHLLGGRWIKKLDLSDWGGFTDITLPNLPVLEELIMGNERGTYGLTEFSVSANLPMIKKMVMRNYVNIPSLNLSRCSRLEEVDLRGCVRMSTAQFAESSPLVSIKLPENFQTLSLVSLPKIERSGIEFDGITNLIGLRCENCSNLVGFDLYNEIISTQGSKLAYIRIDGINKSGDGSDLRAIKERRMGGIDVSGNLVNDKCKLIGNYQLTSYLDEEEFNEFRAYFDELNLRQPQYTVIESDETILKHANMSNLDNSTGVKFGVPYVPSAHLKKIVSQIHRVLGKQEVSGVMNVIRLHDDNSLKYDNGGGRYTTARDAIVDGSQGDIWTYFPGFYYKGVNDIINSKKWAVYSTDPSPDKPEGKMIQGEDLRALETRYVQSYASGVRLSECVKDMTRSSDFFSNDCYPIIAKVPVSGWKRIYAPICDNSLGMATIFFDESDRKISIVAFTPENDYQYSGMQTIMEIPEGAEYVILCYPNVVAPQAYVWLTNSDNPADWEPEWVRSEPYLVASLPSVNKNGKLMSIFDPDNRNFSHNNILRSELENAEQRGGITITDYERMKNLLLLWRFYNGTRNPWSENFDGRHFPFAIEDMLKIGMLQPTYSGQYSYEFLPSENIPVGHVERYGIRERLAYSQNILGVGLITTSVSQYLHKDRTLCCKNTSELTRNHYLFGQGRNWLFRVWCGVTNRFAWFKYSDRWYNDNRMSWGRYMDIFTCQSKYTNQNFSSGLGGNIRANYDTSKNTVLMLGQTQVSSHERAQIILDSHSSSGDEFVGGQWQGVRLLFDKSIKFVESPDEYENIPMNF